MDSISNKIEIIFAFDKNKVVDKELIKSRNLKVIAEIEGELIIWVNNKLFFQEQYILLLELGIQLTKWMKNNKNGKVQDFKYETMDYSYGPILEFIKQKNNYWKIYSVWQKTEINEIIQFNELALTIENFLNKLKQQLYAEYKINMMDFIAY
jgi:hypothetical protein